jgi:hypothetical protein
MPSCAPPKASQRIIASPGIRDDADCQQVSPGTEDSRCDSSQDSRDRSDVWQAAGTLPAQRGTGSIDQEAHREEPALIAQLYPICRSWARMRAPGISVSYGKRRRDLSWDCDKARDLPEPSIGAEQDVIALDEMCSFAIIPAEAIGLASNAGQVATNTDSVKALHPARTKAISALRGDGGRGSTRSPRGRQICEI